GDLSLVTHSQEFRYGFALVQCREIAFRKRGFVAQDLLKYCRSLLAYAVVTAEAQHNEAQGQGWKNKFMIPHLLIPTKLETPFCRSSQLIAPDHELFCYTSVRSSS